MIGIISLFTGMIAPVVGNNSVAYPFPLTDVQILAYIILLCLAIGFYLVSVRRWGMFRITWLAILILLGYISSLAISGDIHAIQSGYPLLELRWGWIFIIVGSIALLYTIIYDQGDDSDSPSLFSDAIIGVVGTITLVALSALIIKASLWYTRWPSSSVLEQVFWSGSISSSSGITQTEAYNKIESLSFERRNDSISFMVPTDSGAIMKPSGAWYPGNNVRSETIAGHTLVTSSSGTWLDGKIIESNEHLSRDWDILLREQGGVSSIISHRDIDSYTGISIVPGEIVLSETTTTVAWVNKTASGYEIMKDGKTISIPYAQISELGISRSGYDTLALAYTQSGGIIVVKNGAPIENIRTGYREGSWKNNGSHSIYITEENDIRRIIYDGVSIGKEFGEIREVFLEKSGNNYAFFARPIGETEYCIFTRFRGNLCGLRGYMNPRMSADGSSIIFAGLRDGIWGIYRNTDTIIRDTGYTNTDISRDYAFFDITNPKQYVFLEYTDGKYKVRKNGKIIPWTWDDVGLDVTFGYDNKVIMSAKDSEGWRVLEF
jgi:hypothetical protein